MLKNKKGQSTLEYVILVTAVIVVIIVFLMGGDASFFQTQMNDTLASTSETMTSMSGRFSKAFNTTP